MGKFLDKLSGAAGGNLPLGMFFLLVFTVVLVQIGSLLLTQMFGIKQLALGPALGLISIIAVLTAAFMSALSPESFGGEGWIGVGLLVAVVIFTYFILPDLAPEFFQPAMSSLKVQTLSVLGMG